MTKIKKKIKEVDGFQFLSNLPSNQWPEGVTVNGESESGYSYNMNGVLVEISDTDWLIDTAGIGGFIVMCNEVKVNEYE